MATITERLARTLNPKLRLQEKPPPNPLTEEEIKDLIRRTEPNPTQTTTITDKKRLRDISQQLDKAQGTFYLKLLETNTNGANIERIYEIMEEEGYNRDITDAVLKKLAKKKYISETPQKINIPIKQIPGTKIITVEIKKILPRKAIVNIDGRWTAELTPENYEGPLKLLKKKTVFKAQGTLFQLDGNLHVTIRHVIQKL